MIKRENKKMNKNVTNIAFAALAICIAPSLFASAYKGLSGSSVNKTKILDASVAGLTGHSKTNLIRNTNSAKAFQIHSVKGQSYYDIAAYNLLIEHEANSGYNPTIAKANTLGYYNITKQREKILQQNEARLAAIKTQKQKNHIYRLSGYCTIPNEITVKRMQRYSVMRCVFNNNPLGLKKGDMFAEFIPLPKHYALIGKPIYISNSFLGGRRVPIDNGVIMTIDRTSLNIANRINNVAIKDLLAKSALTLNTVAYQGAVAYLSAVQQSNTTTQLSSTSTTSGTNTATATNTKPPSATTYLATAGIQFISNLIGLAGSYYINHNIPLYTIFSDSQVYVNFTLQSKNFNGNINYGRQDYKKIVNPFATKYAPPSNFASSYNGGASAASGR